MSARSRYKLGAPNKSLSEERVRKRNAHFLSAKEYASVPGLDYREAWGSLGSVVSCAKSYRKEVKNKKIVLRDTETDELVFLDYYTRFSDEYYFDVCDKLNEIVAKDAVFLTLTINPRRFVSLKHAYAELQKSWSKLLDMLQGRWDHKLKFVKIVEFQKNGSPHLHVLFFGITRLIDANELRVFWDKIYGEGTFVKLEHIKNDYAKVISYIQKYLIKRLEDSGEYDDLQELEHLGLSWALNLRAFSSSRGIFNNVLKTNSDKIFEYIGCFDVFDCECMVGKKYAEVELLINRLGGGGYD